MSRSHPLARGRRYQSMVRSGSRMAFPLHGVPTRWGVGCTPRMAGHGSQIYRGAGLPFTTDAGRLLPLMAGSGSLALSGALPG